MGLYPSNISESSAQSCRLSVTETHTQIIRVSKWVLHSSTFQPSALKTTADSGWAEFPPQSCRHAAAHSSSKRAERLLKYSDINKVIPDSSTITQQFNLVVRTQKAEVAERPMQRCLPQQESCFGHNPACAVKPVTHTYSIHIHTHTHACTLAYTCAHSNIPHFCWSLFTFKAFSDKCLATRGALLTLATASTHHRPKGAHLSLTSCLADLCLREREREKERKKFSYPVTSLQARSREWGWARHATWGSAAWRFSPLLFQLSGYSPKPKGVFNGGFGITGLTVNSSKVKGLGHCPKPSMLHTP